MKIIIEPIFKSKDRVYHYKYGWGTIMEIHNGINERILIEFDEVKNLIREMKSEGNLLSFTEYKLEGFSQERPEKTPNKGDIVWIKEIDTKMYVPIVFMEAIEDLYVLTFNFISIKTMHKDFVETTNPYKDEKI